MTQEDLQKAWTKLARRTTRKLNAGWWLQAFTPIVVFSSLVAFAAIFYFRSRFYELTIQNMWPWVAGGVVAAAIIAWLLARKNFQDIDYGFTRLESRMRMHNALNAARAGASAWPELPLKPIDGIHWKWDRIAAPAGITAAFLTAAFAWPFVEPEPDAVLPPAEPLAWDQMESALEQLEEKEVADEEDIKEIQKQIEQLRDRPEEEWYSHNSMEATDTLRQALMANIQKLGANMARTQRVLNAMENFADQMNDTTKSRLLDEYKKAVDGMSAGGLRANSALREALKGINPGQLSQLSKEQLEQLSKQLADAAGQCKGCLGEGMSDDLAELMALIEGEGEQEAPGGFGGIKRGPGHTPLRMSKEETDLGTRNFEGVESDDVSRAGIADVLDETIREHEVDRTEIGVRAAGDIGSTGSGGDAVWRSQLLPEEKAVLKEYFE